MKHTLLIVVLVTVTGCASQPDELEAQYVSPTQYENFDCEQVRLEMIRVSNRVDELYGTLKKTADDDAAQMGIGLVLFWPALFFLEGGDTPQAGEYSRLKGEYQALEAAAVRKKCPMQRGATVAIAPPAAAATTAVVPAAGAAQAKSVVALAPPMKVPNRGGTAGCDIDSERDFRVAVEAIAHVSVLEYRAPAVDPDMHRLWKPDGTGIEPDVKKVANEGIFQDAAAVMLVAYEGSGGWYCIQPRFNLYLVDRSDGQVIRARTNSQGVRQEMTRLLRQWRQG